MSAVLPIPEWVFLYYVQPKCTAVFNTVITTAIQPTVYLHFAKYFFKFINLGKSIVQFIAPWPCQNKFATQNWVATHRFINASVNTGSRQRSRRILSYLPISILSVSKHVQACTDTLNEDAYFLNDNCVKIVKGGTECAESDKNKLTFAIRQTNYKASV
jgi:hypothetical protein